MSEKSEATVTTGRNPRVRIQSSDTAHPLLHDGGHVDRRLLARLLVGDLPAGVVVTYGEVTLYPSERTPTALVACAPNTNKERVVNPSAHRTGDDLLATLEEVADDLA